MYYVVDNEAVYLKKEQSGALRIVEWRPEAPTLFLFEMFRFASPSTVGYCHSLSHLYEPY